MASAICPRHPLGLPLVLLLAAIARVSAAESSQLSLPSYHYGAAISVECMNRSSPSCASIPGSGALARPAMASASGRLAIASRKDIRLTPSRRRETGEHIENPENHELQWIPFPVCEETNKPLEFHYGIEAEVNCTIPMVSDPFFHLLEFYVHSDAPLSCRLPSRPPPHVEIVDEKPVAQEYIPLVFALAGTLQFSHMHISTHMNVLLHSTPKHHIHPHDSGVLDSGIAYSTSPLSHMAGTATRKLIIGDPLPLSFSVRWFPTPALPKTEGRVEWQGMGGHIYASTVFYSLVSFMAGICVTAVYFFGMVLPKRLKGRALGGATPLGYGLNGVGNGWGIPMAKRAID